MKQLINNPSDIVREMLEGIARQCPDLAILGEDTVLVRRDLPAASSRPVAVISGGGSGHEPAHGGYVGAGMLSAAVCGEVFTSPPTDAVLAAIRAAAGSAGALLIIKNYTGDRLNFGLAAELARAEGIEVELVVVADDVALRHQAPRSKRRGIAGTVLIHKVAGAAAASGLPLHQVAAIARAAADEIGTMGVALDGCTLPGSEKSGFVLSDNEIELGLGIHGEKGVVRTMPMSADKLAETLIHNILDDLSIGRGNRVALLVNGLGATPQIELDVVLRAAYEGLGQRGIVVERAWSGTLLSALNMPGCSISIMKVNDERLALLDAGTSARAWPGPGYVNQAIYVDAPAVAPTLPAVKSASGAGIWVGKLKPALAAVAQTLIANEPKLTDLDSLAGDGDLGASMKRAANAILAVSDDTLSEPGIALAALAAALRKAIAGSSGPFYATALARASRQLGDATDPSAKEWARAFQSAVAAISDLGGAKAGDRTMLDALVPAAAAFERELDAGTSTNAAWATAVSAAEEGAHRTASMAPRAGRASYLGQRAVGSPDGGAVAVALWIGALRPFIT